MSKTTRIKGSAATSNGKAKVAKAKVTTSSQQDISIFFANKTPNGLFSTFGSSNKNEKKVLNLSTKKKTTQDVQAATKTPTNANTAKTNKATEKILSSKKNCTPDLNYESQAIKNTKSPKCVLSKSYDSMILDDDSDDDMIPPTPSPDTCQRSFIRPSSLVTQHNHTPPSKSQQFTNLKLKQAIDKREKLINRSKVSFLTNNKRPSKLVGECEDNTKIVGHTSASLKSNDSKRSAYSLSINQRKTGRDLIYNSTTIDNDELLQSLLNETTKETSNISDDKHEAEGSLSKRTADTQDHFKNADLILFEGATIGINDSSNLVQNTTIESKSNDSEFNQHHLLHRCPSNLGSQIIDFDLDNSGIDIGFNDSGAPAIGPQKIVMKKGKVKSLKRSASKGISPNKKRHHGDVVQHSFKDTGGISLFDSDEDQDISLLYGHSTPINKYLGNNTEINKVKLGEIHKKDRQGHKTPIKECDRHSSIDKTPNKEDTRHSDSRKTPIKDYDRHSISNISLLTPTKNSPNTSRDSLMGVELDGLMDGVEWSPMPKKTLPRSKLFEEYSPHTTPYSRFLVLEVYRRESNNDETISQYGRPISEKVLRLFDESQAIERYCYLRQDWEMTEVEPGDVVHVTGEFDMASGVCILDNNRDQYIVIHPDTLVSGTTVAGATRCLRRSILNERFRTEDTNEAMLMGTFLHELFDHAMKANEFSPEYLTSQAKALLQQHSYLNSLYSLGITEVNAMDKINPFIPEFSKWAKRYVNSLPDPDLGIMDYKTVSGPETSEQPSVCIAKLKDIEENVWSPRFGLKGKVDATVEVKIDRRPKIRRHRPDKDNTIETYVVPFELKTGKVFSKLGSVDHRAQVILYTLLLSDRHRQPTDSGVLYYMKAAHMVGIPALVHEKRALVMRRNEVARYLTLSRSIAGRQMPGMLKDAHTCNRCSQAQNCTLFHKSQESGDHVTSGLGEDFNRLTDHVTSKHAGFFSNWFKLVCLEGKEIQQSGKTSQHHIWSMKGAEREVLGHCFSGMVLVSRCYQLDSDKLFIHKFQRSVENQNKTPFVEIPLTSGDAVVISEEDSSMVAISTGYIQSIKTNEVLVSLDRDLTKSYRSSSVSKQTPIYRIDKNNGYNTLTTLWSNIAKLLHNDKSRNAQLRQLIIDLKPPGFARSRQTLINFGSQSSSYGSQQSLSSQGSTGTGYRDVVTEAHMEGLNVDQKRAIMKVLSAEDYTLILGMPGTGKTTTIACMVRMMVTRGKTVLLTSYTHTAVDNILLKLKQLDIDFLRLGQVHKMLPEIQPYSTQVAGAHIKTVNELKEFYMSKNVVATTCLGVNHALFSQRSFDYCIVDEASQITLPVCLGPLHHADVFVLVGDHYQLPPLVQSLEAREGGMDISLFKHLSEHHPQAMVCLEHQYRMNKDIMMLSNSLIYENRLKCGTQEIAHSVLDIPRWEELTALFTSGSQGSEPTENWVLTALDPSRPVIFLNTDNVPGTESRKEGLVSNETEAAIVQQLTSALDIGGVLLSSVGIISPYRHQLKLIREALGQDPRDSTNILEINTVDKYQGRDKACILVSLVRSNDTSSVGDLLKDWRRVNVAVTRAKTKLILIGSLRTLKASLLFHELLDLMETNRWVYELPKDAHTMYEVLKTRSLPSQQ